MTPKEKAKELVNKYLQVYDGKVFEAKLCSFIAVDELIQETRYEVPNIRQRYWLEVKQEIENL